MILLGVSSYFYEQSSSGGGGAVGQVSIATTVGNINASTFVDVTLTVSSNPNRALLAFVGSDDTLTCTSVSYTAGSGGAWVSTGRFDNGNRIYSAWMSVNPSSTSVTVRAGMDGASTADNNMVLYSLYNVDQVTPADNYSTRPNNFANLTIPVTASSMAFAHISGPADAGAIVTGIENYANVNNEFWKAGSNSSGVIAWTSSTNQRGMQGLNVRPG